MEFVCGQFGIEWGQVGFYMQSVYDHIQLWKLLHTYKFTLTTYNPASTHRFETPGISPQLVT